MKTYVHSWQYLAEFFLELEMFHTEVVEKMKTHTVSSISFFPRKWCRLWDNVEKHGTAWQATDGSIIRRIACWITWAINTCPEEVILVTFPL